MMNAFEHWVMINCDYLFLTFTSDLFVLFPSLMNCVWGEN